MTEELFKLILQALIPKTLAYLVRDLEESQADWQYYPNDAPPDTVQEKMRQTLEVIKTIGAERAAAEGLDFAQLLHQVGEEQQQEDWAWQRDRQEQQNWTNDLE